ncbi:MAG: hypothetical protein PVJ92_00040 [Candidatus Dependentiae bacterium]|jgi:chromosome segregation ATPase
MKAIITRSQYIFIFTACATLHAASTTPTIAERFSSVETNLSICRSKKSSPEETKAAATEALDTCSKLRQQVRDRLNLERNKREEAEQQLQQAQKEAGQANDWQQRFNILEAQLFEARRALEAKTAEVRTLQDRVNNQSQGYAQARTQFNQMKQHNAALQMQLQQVAQQHSTQPPATTQPAVAPQGATVVPGTA